MLQVQAYEYLKELIKNDDLDPDKFYSLNQMAKEHGFSRTPLPGRSPASGAGALHRYLSQQRLQASRHDP